MMPTKSVKDLYLYSNTDELQKDANLTVGNTLMGYKKLLESAEKYFDNGKLKESEGDEELAYVYYMRASHTFQSSRKAKDYSDSRDRSYWNITAGKHMTIAIQKAETLFQSLQRRYSLKHDLEEADKAEAMASKNNYDLGSQFGDNGKAISSTEGDSATDTESENSSHNNGATTITAYELYQKLDKEPKSILILDTRDRNSYNCHIVAPNCINVPLDEMRECYTAKQFEARLPISDRTLFRKRHSFEHIILADICSDDANEALGPGKPLGILKAAIVDFDNIPLLRPPLLLSGGFESWYISFPSYCTQPTIYQSNSFKLDSGQENEKYFPELWSYPSLDSPMEVEMDVSSDRISSHFIPSIPDRSTKPAFVKTGANDMKMVGENDDYVQLQLPKPSWESPSAEDDTQAVFDKSVSNHIGMREKLNSIGEKLSHLNDSNYETEKVPQPKDHNDEFDKFTQPKQSSDTITSFDSRPSQMEQERPKYADDGKPKILGGTKKETNLDKPVKDETVNQPRVEERPDIQAFQPTFQSNRPPPIPDRTSKPDQRSHDQPDLERLELDWYMTHIRRLQGIEGRVAPGLTGLKNLGNSCYMNSTVQCLSNIPIFLNFFLSGKYRKAINYENKLGSQGNVARNVAVLFGGLWEGRFRYIVPVQFKQCIGTVAPVFANCDQQDAQEFLVFLLDGLHEDLNLVKERFRIPEQNNDGLKNEDAACRAWMNHEKLNSSIIVNMFQGQYLSVVRCRVCHKESRTFDVFMYLSLPIPTDRKCRLEDCLEKFLVPEEMTGDCKWFCPHCARKRDATKQIFIWKLPKVLLIHLKRFSCNGRWREKLHTNVDFPTNRLDMSQYSHTRASSYTLLGISNHYGSIESGHYTAFCKNAIDNHWYKFDDNEVSPISQGSVKTSAAYILYYMADDAFDIQR